MPNPQPTQMEQRMVTEEMIEAGIGAWPPYTPPVNGKELAAIYLAMHAVRPTADLGDDGELDTAAMLYQESGQLDDPARAKAIRQAADRLVLCREALTKLRQWFDGFECAGGDCDEELAIITNALEGIRSPLASTRKG